MAFTGVSAASKTGLPPDPAESTAPSVDHAPPLTERATTKSSSVADRSRTAKRTVSRVRKVQSATGAAGAVVAAAVP